MFKRLLITLMFCVPFQAQAVNLYQDGTAAHSYAEFADTVLPHDVATLFIGHGEGYDFDAQLDAGKFASARVDDAVMSRARSYTYSGVVPANAILRIYDNKVAGSPVKNLCVVHLYPSSKALDTTAFQLTILHEFMHCRVNHWETDKEFRAKGAQLVNISAKTQEGTELTINQKAYIINEMFGSLMVGIAIHEHGIKQAVWDEYVKDLKKGFPINAGPQSLPYALNKCLTQWSCTTAPAATLSTLLKDEAFIAKFTQDMQQIAKTSAWISKI